MFLQYFGDKHCSICDGLTLTLRAHYSYSSERPDVAIFISPVSVTPRSRRWHSQRGEKLDLALSGAAATLAKSSLAHTFTRRDLSIVPTEPSVPHNTHLYASEYEHKLREPLLQRGDMRIL
jgi:hypothetical protein